MADATVYPEGSDGSSRYRAPGMDVVSEEFGDETIIIQLNSGTYYSLNPAATAVWRLACGGYTLEETIKACGGKTAAGNGDVAVVWGALVKAGLVRCAEPGADAPAPAPEVRLEARPRISEYADMQELFQLDPVHDVDENGWPSTPAPTPRV